MAGGAGAVIRPAKRASGSARPDESAGEKAWHTRMALAGKGTAADDNPFTIIAGERVEWGRWQKQEKTSRV